MRRTILGLLLSLLLATTAAAAHRPTVSVEDLTLLAASDLSNETILVFLDRHEIGFEFDPETISRLRQQGVSDEIIRYLLERRDLSSERVARVAYVSVGAHPHRYYEPYYRDGVLPYFGAAILWHWAHGYHWVDHRLVGGYHFGHPASHGGRGHSRGGHGGGHGGGGH